MSRYTMEDAVKNWRGERIPLAIGVDDEAIWPLYAETAFLGARYHSIVVFRSHPKYDSEFVADFLRCRLEPNGTWVEFP